MRTRGNLIAFASLILLVSVFAISVKSATALDTELKGPFVDGVTYKIITAEDQRVLALLSEEIDMIDTVIDPVYIPQLEAASNIEIDEWLRNGYGHFTINCDSYPLNETALRRAFSFALDKELVCTDTFNNLASPLDSPISLSNPWSIEGELPYNYYSASVATGNALLTAAGFLDIDADGFREAPDGSDFQITIEVPTGSPVAADCGSAAYDALDALSIDVVLDFAELFELMPRIQLHGSFDIVFLGANFYDYSPQFLYTYFSSDYYGVDYYNPSNFANATFDAWADQMMHAPTYSEVWEAVEEMQKILIYESPRVPIYCNINHHAYRTDDFEGHRSMPSYGLSNFWTNLNVQQKTICPFGSNFIISLSGEIDSFNHMTSSSAYSREVLDNLHLTLLKHGPDGTPVNWFAESILSETHSENSDVPVGHQRFTITTLDNATWSDGPSVDANDVAFSINYYIDSIAYGNPTGVNIQGLVTAYVPSPNTVVVEFDSVSYWNLDSFAYLPILPDHIFSVIGLSGWNTWNPVFSDSMITAAPFSVTAFSSGDYAVLSKRSDFFYRPEVPSPPIITPLLVAIGFEGIPGDVITWDASSNFPDHYELVIDSALVANETWDGGDISFSFDHLAFGTYSYTLTVYACGGVAIDSGLIMVMDITPPNLVSSPGNTTYVQGAPENTISWSFNDTNPGVYQMFVDAEPYRAGLWNSSSEAIDLDLTNLTLGEHNITVLVVDYGFNQAMDTIYVNVIAFAPEMLLLLVGGIGVAIVIVIVIFKAKNR